MDISTEHHNSPSKMHNVCVSTPAISTHLFLAKRRFVSNASYCRTDATKRSPRKLVDDPMLLLPFSLSRETCEIARVIQATGSKKGIQDPSIPVRCQTVSDGTCIEHKYPLWDARLRRVYYDAHRICPGLGETRKQNVSKSADARVSVMFRRKTKKNQAGRLETRIASLSTREDMKRHLDRQITTDRNATCTCSSLNAGFCCRDLLSDRSISSGQRSHKDY